MIEPTEADIGREVIYQGSHPDDRESGVISSFNDKYVFVHATAPTRRVRPPSAKA